MWCCEQPVQSASTELIFLSPAVDSSSSPAVALSYDVSFVMDAVQSVQRIVATFSVRQNPALLAFRDGTKHYRGEILTLDVSHFE